MNVALNTRNAYEADVRGTEGLPPIIDVKTGQETDRKGFTVTTSRTGAVSGVARALSPGQDEDLEALLAVLGLDSEHAKHATTQTVFKAIQSAIKQQALAVTTCVTAISDYDVARLQSLKKAMAGSDDPNAQAIVANVERMMALKAEIEDLANTKGMVYDGTFEGAAPNPNFALNTRVREMGDRMGDIRHYKAAMGAEMMDARLDALAPAMKTAVGDLLAAYDQTSGWGVQVHVAYSKMSKTTLQSFANVIASRDLNVPAQISRDALAQIVKEIMEETAPDTAAEQLAERLEEKMQEIAAQINDIDIPLRA